MADPALDRLLRWYPQAWRDRYGEELVVFMQDSYGNDKAPVRARLSLAVGGVRERARRSGLSGDSVPPADRVRGGVLMVLCSWTAMVVAGACLAKMSEHFDEALPHDAAAHHLPDLSFTFIQTTGGVAGLIVLAGAGLAVPAFLRHLRSGGWPSIRPHLIRAVVATVPAAGTTAALSVWAHRLTAAQRSGGSVGYEVLFLVWAASVIVALVLWTVLAVVAAHGATFPRPVLLAEATLAATVALAVVAILAATGLWWALIGARAPEFLSGQSAAPYNGPLVVTVALMALAAGVATAGTVRIARSLAGWAQV